MQLVKAMIFKVYLLSCLCMILMNEDKQTPNSLPCQPHHVPDFVVKWISPTGILMLWIIFPVPPHPPLWLNICVEWMVMRKQVGTVFTSLPF